MDFEGGIVILLIGFYQFKTFLWLILLTVWCVFLWNDPYMLTFRLAKLQDIAVFSIGIKVMHTSICVHVSPVLHFVLFCLTIVFVFGEPLDI